MGSSPDTILLTRPEAQSLQTRAHLGPGVKTIVSPLTRIVFRSAEFSAAQAVLFTSRNGIEGALAAGLRPEGRAVCVGDATAARATAAGFSALSANGTAEDLTALALSELSPDRGPLLHPRGLHTDPALKKRLTEAGFTVGCVPVYSPRAGRLLGAGWSDDWRLDRTRAIAISAAAAVPLQALGFATVQTTPEPTGAAMLGTIAAWLSENSRCTAP